MRVEQKIEAAIELLNVRCDALPQAAHLEVTECIVKLRKALKIASEHNIKPGQCRGGKNCTCCCAGCDCGCINDCPQFRSQRHANER